MPKEEVTFTEKQVDFVWRSIAAGDYQDVIEVVRAGLRLLQEWHDEKLQAKVHLRGILLEAKAGGVSKRTLRKSGPQAKRGKPTG